MLNNNFFALMIAALIGFLAGSASNLMAQQQPREWLDDPTEAVVKYSSRGRPVLPARDVYGNPLPDTDDNLEGLVPLEGTQGVTVFVPDEFGQQHPPYEGHPHCKIRVDSRYYLYHC